MRRQLLKLVGPPMITNEEADRLIAERRSRAKVGKPERIRQEIEAAKDRLSIRHFAKKETYSTLP